MFPRGDPQKTCERLLSLQLKLKRFPLLALEVSESLPSISDGLGHCKNEDVDFELLQCSDLQMICPLGEGISHPLMTLLTSRNLFWVQSPSWHRAAGSFGDISSGSLCCSIVSNPTVRPDPVLSSSFFSFPHPFAVVNAFLGWDDYLMVIAALRARFPSRWVGAEEKYSGPFLLLCWRPPGWCWALSIAVDLCASWWHSAPCRGCLVLSKVGPGDLCCSCSADLTSY